MAKAQLAESYANLPLSFVANAGQTDGHVRFLSRGSGYGIFLTNDAATLSLSKHSCPLQSSSVAPRAEKVADLERCKKDTAVVNMRLAGGANTTANPVGEAQLPGTANYFVGNDPAAWRSAVPTFAKVRYPAVYPGIDLVYYGNQRQLEYDFALAPNADPGAIRMQFSGVTKLKLNPDGDLVVSAKDGDITFRRPVVYQGRDGRRQLIDGRFTLGHRHSIGFKLGAYDPSQPVIIDPVLVYSTYVGGSGSNGDEALALAVDSSGDAYITGQTDSSNFPVTSGAVQTTDQATASTAYNAFVTKLNATGTAVVYSTYLGGSGNTQGDGIAVDSSGNAYVTGHTFSTDFPITSGAFQTASTANASGYTAFVSKLNPTGTALAYSTYLGGSGNGSGTGESTYGIVVNNSGNAYVTGYTYSANFPTTSGVFQATNNAAAHTASDAFVTELNPAGSGLVFSTFLGGSGQHQGGDIGYALAVNSAGDVFVTGSTGSTDFPTTTGAYQTTNPAGAASMIATFISELNPTGTALVYSTYLGGSSGSLASAIAVDGSGNAYVTGYTMDMNFPVTSGAFQTTNNAAAISATTGFVTKINPTGTALVYSTLLGGSGISISAVNTEGDSADGIQVDTSGDAYVTGTAYSTNFPVTSNAGQATNPGAGNESFAAFVTELNPAGTALLYSTYLGGSGNSFGMEGYYRGDSGLALALDSSDNVYVAGGSFSGNFPVTSGAYQSSNLAASTSGSNAFVSKISLAPAVATTTAVASSANPQSPGSSVTFTATVSPASGTTAPAGSVVFTVDGATAATVTLGTSGTATYATSTLAAGTHTVTAAYGGSASFAASTSSTLTQTIAKPTAVAPAFSPAVGAYSSSQSVKLSSTTTGATIYYTTNGTTPTTSSTKYKSAITVSATETIEAIAVASGYNNSVVASGTYTIEPSAATPTFSVAGGNYTTTQSVKISDTTKGATIYYTTDGTTPTTSSSNYTAAISVWNSEKIEAIAVATGYINSAVATATYSFPLTLSTTSLSYPTTTIGTASSSQSVTLTNSGAAALTISSISVTGTNASSFVFTNNCGTSLAVGASCTIQGQFAPTATGALAAAVTIVDNVGTSPQTITLSGTGVAPVATLSATSLLYPTTTIGAASSSQSVTLTNTGTAALTISNITVTGTNASSFVFANNCGTSLAIGASCTIQGQFAPTAIGALTAAVTITDNAGTSPQTIALSGTGLDVTTQLAITTGGQVVAGVPFTATVSALDAGGNFVTTYSGTVALASSDPLFVNSGVVTLTNGMAQTAVTLKTSGTQTITATGSGLAGSGSFTVSAGPASTLQIRVPQSATSDTAFNFTVSAYDLYGNQASGYAGTLAFSSTDPGAVLPSATTLSSGAGTFSATLMTPGAQTITATDSVNGLRVTSSSISVSNLVVPSVTSINFGQQPVGVPSAVQTLSLSVSAGTSIGSIGILTTSKAKLDFLDGGSSSCTATAYASLTTCAVSVSFTPQVAGIRIGAVLVLDAQGKQLASVPVFGVGTGAAVAYGPAPTTSITPLVNSQLLAKPCGTAVDGAGDLFIADGGNNRVVEVAAGSGATTSITPTVNGLGLAQPCGVVMDGAGDLFIADAGNSRVVEMPAGGGAVIAISPTVNGQALAQPNGLAIDAAGDLFIADRGNNRVVEIPAGGAAATSIAPTVNGLALNQPGGLAVDAAGDLFIADGLNNRVVEVVAGGGPATSIAPTVNGAALNQPDGLAVDAAGDLFIVDAGNNRVVEVVSGGAALAINPTANGQAVVQPGGLTIGGSGNLFLTDAGNNRVVEVERSQAPALSFATATTVRSTDSADGTQTVQVENIGNQPLTIYSVNYPADFFAAADANPCVSSDALAPGQLCDLAVQFSPQNAGALGETVTLTDNAGTSPQTITLSGTGLAPLATLSATSLSYPTTTVGTASSSQTVTLTNTGTAALTISSIAVTGANASSFVFANNCGTSLAVGASCTVHGHFAPTATGALAAAVTIVDNTGTSSQTITLSGTGVAPVGTLSATSISYPTTTVGTASSSQSVTLTNTGSAALTIGSIALTGTNASSFVFANNCGTSLAVGASCTIQGQFAPTATGILAAAVTIVDNTGTSPQAITLSGTGVQGPVVLSATSLSFGSVGVGTSSASQSVTMTNTGTAPLTITSIAVSGANASSFVFANSCGTSLAAGANCTIHGHFTPATAGALTAAVTIIDSAITSPQKIALNGTGLSAVSATLSATNLSFGSVGVGSSSASQSVTMTNTGTATLTITSIAVTGTNASSFVFANSCGTSLAAGASCTIHGHFAPTATGAATAAVTITDSAAGSPQTIALSGTGK